MEVKLASRGTDFYRCNLDTTLQQEETLEMIVPDSMPDVGRILFVSGTTLMRSKEATDGKVSVAGLVNLSVIYIPEDGSHVRRVEGALSFTAAAESPEVRGGDRIIAVSRAVSTDARAVNPRKLVLRADLLTRIQVFGERRLELACPAGETEGLELLCAKKSVALTTDVREKTFVISDEFPIAAGKPELDEILKVSVELSAGECKAVGNKLIFKGEARIDMLYSAREDGSLCHTDFSAGFSQVVEMGDGQGEREFAVALMLTGAYFEPVDPEEDGRRVLMELHMAAQATARETVELEYIEDAYCPRFQLESQMEEQVLDCVLPGSPAAETGRATLQTPTVPARVLGAELRMGRCRAEDGKFLVTANAAIVYAGEDGGISGVTGRFEFACDGMEEVLPVSAQAGEPVISIVDEGFELRLPFQIETEVHSRVTIRALSEIQPQEDAPRDLSALPSLVLVRAGQESLWTLAKRYSSSAKLICQANGFEALPEDGGLIMIPKMR